ncbi:translocator protein homolog [Brachypodium distachyon]|uniref:Peripheral-type benzodiazepine receptor n=1 Tax=Brachypodium distachyon TaxID=15368 RepID=I1HLR1_BRADI|nr:translocator protein homolog [Brachypodium distachyon]KQK07460.1 hypothetical protein BRADI_2g35610v3 [Brachypodium distachyon]PNT71789.1 hypothetical protein BRADI_2g35610v3 [Brachypodium distachyon]|eukprot:XP_003566543.1 translocator protein homolog [Brachypodium distachyon]
MDSTAAVQDQGLTRRAGRDADTAPAPSRDHPRSGKQKLGRAKRGLRSLAAAVTLSAALTAAAFYYASSGTGGASVAVARAGSVAAEAVMALAAWMVWAEGGLHRRPGATLAPFAAQLLAAAAWPALALKVGSGWAGMGCCGAMAAGAAACVRGFGAVNPVAGDLAKPCVAWAVLLAVINYKML